MSNGKNFYIITGGPGSGKTTLIEALKALNYTCVDEVARKIIREQIKINGDATHTQNQRDYFELMLSRSIYTYDEITEKTNPVFFDRGIPELMGYCRLIGKEVPEYLHNAIKLYRYNPIVFVLPPWKEIYCHDEERKQSWDEAVETYHRIIRSYTESNYKIIELPLLSVDERVKYILSHINTAIKNITFTELKHNDIDEIVSSFKKIGWNKPSSIYEAYLQEQKNGHRTIILAKENKLFCGYATVKWTAEYPPFCQQNIPEIADLNVLPHYRNRGIGTALIKTIENMAKNRGHNRIGLGVGMTKDYGNAQRLYINLGFIPDGNGLHYKNMQLQYGEKTIVDDDLVIYLTQLL